MKQGHGYNDEPVLAAQGQHSDAKMEAMLVCNSMKKGGIFCGRHGPWICKKGGLSSRGLWGGFGGFGATSFRLNYSFTINIEFNYTTLIP